MHSQLESDLRDAQASNTAYDRVRCIQICVSEFRGEMWFSEPTNLMATFSFRTNLGNAAFHFSDVLSLFSIFQRTSMPLN